MRRNRMWAVFLSAVLLAGSFSFSYGDSGESGTALDGEFLPDIETEDQKRVTAGSRHNRERRILSRQPRFRGNRFYSDFRTGDDRRLGN